MKPNRYHYLVCYSCPDGKGGVFTGYADMSMASPWRAGTANEVARDLANDLREERKGQGCKIPEFVSITSVTAIEP